VGLSSTTMTLGDLLPSSSLASALPTAALSIEPPLAKDMVLVVEVGDPSCGELRVPADIESEASTSNPPFSRFDIELAEG